MLYLEHPTNTFATWTGQPINGIAHPRSIATRWAEAELNAIGLFTPTRPDVPEGKRAVSETVQRVEGVVQFVYELEDEPAPSTDPIDYPLTMRQMRLGLIRHGYPVTLIADVISAISDPAQQAEATVWYEESTHVRFEHPMTQTLMAAAGITTEQAAAMWMLAKDYEL